MGTAPKPPLGGRGTAAKSATGWPWARAILEIVRRQVIAGLLLALPFVITFWIVYGLYSTLEVYVIGPVAQLVVRVVAGQTGGADLPLWFTRYVAPLLGILGVILLLYFLGAFARWRLAGLIDRLLLRVPVVKVIHHAVSKIFLSLRGEGDLTRFKRIVLVSYPHPGMRVPGFVTSSCRDAETHQTILCVYVPTTPVPTSGYMLLIPEQEVTELDWNLEETVQAVASFGFTAPNHVRYFTNVQGVEATAQWPQRSSPACGPESGRADGKTAQQD